MGFEPATLQSAVRQPNFKIKSSNVYSVAHTHTKQGGERARQSLTVDSDSETQQTSC